MSKKVLIVTGSDYTDQVYEGLDHARDKGNELYLLSDGSFTPRAGFFEKHFTYDLRKTTEVLSYMAAQPERFDAVVIKTSEWLTPLVALLVQYYGVSGNEPRVAFNCRSKYHMRQAMAVAGVPIPKFKLAQSKSQLLAAIHEIGFPCVAKPVGGNASYGTFMIRNEQEIAMVAEQYEKSIKFLQGKAIDQDVFGFTDEEMDRMGVQEKVDMISDYLVEEFMDGSEISVDAMVQNGTALIMGVAEQVRMEPPFFVQLAEVMPYVCPPQEQTEIERLTQQTVEAMGIKNSPVHMEFMKTSEGYKVVEIGCRIGGDNIHDAVFQTTGKNLMLEAIHLALGQPLKPGKITGSHVAMRYLLPPQSGVIRGVSGVDQLKKNDHVTEFELNAMTGQVVAVPPDSFDFIGYVSTRGRTPIEARAQLERAVSQLTITIDPA